MDAHFKAILDESETAFQKVHDVLSAVTGSRITLEMEKRVPLIAKLASRLLTVEGFAGAAATILPQAEAAIAVVEVVRAAGGKHADVSTYKPWQDDSAAGSHD